jgi:uncharacterized protein
MAHFAFIEWLLKWLLSQTECSFEWDDGNRTKSLDKHEVSCEEAQEIFEQTEDSFLLGEQVSPPVDEPRYGIIGGTRAGRLLFVCFTIRSSKIRVISVREMSQKERGIYAERRKK